MAYVPILDPASFTSETEPRRRLALAAAGLLQRLARDLSTLREAVGVARPWEPPLQHPSERVRQLLIDKELLAPDGQVDESVLLQLLEQLQEVRAFSELDEESFDGHIEAIARMIRDGRVELFAGRSVRAPRRLSR